MKLNDKQQKAMESLNDKTKQVNMDEFNELMKGTGIKIVTLSQKQIQAQAKQDAEISRYVNELSKQGKTPRQIRRSVWMKYKRKINLTYKQK